MRQLPNVLTAMQFIQRATEEVQANLVVLEVSRPSDVELREQCVDTLNFIWRTANDYEAALPTFVTPFNTEKKD